jgi:putative addiction module component (TIGR02574 family)
MAAAGKAIEALLALPPKERRAAVSRLLSRLPAADRDAIEEAVEGVEESEEGAVEVAELVADQPDELSAAWREELHRRLVAYRTGKVKTTEHAEVMRRLRARLPGSG